MGYEAHLWTMWNSWHLKLSLICDRVHEFESVAEVGGLDVGASTSQIFTSKKDVVATTILQFIDRVKQNGYWR